MIIKINKKEGGISDMILNKLIKKSVLMSMIIGSVALIGCGTQTNEEKVKSENQIVVEHKLGTTTLNDTSKKVAHIL